MKDVEDFYPLSPLQQGLLFHSLSEPGSGMYFNQTRVPLGGELDVDAFRAAWQQVVERHGILRTFFVWEGVKAPIQVVKNSATMPFAIEDWRGVNESDREARFEALRLADLARGFDLSQAPLMRAVLLRTADDRHDFLWSFHHILMDGWSMFHVLQDVFGAYDALRTQGTFAPATPRKYRDHIVWLSKQSLPRAEEFWRRNLAGFTAPTPLPIDPSLHPEPDAKEDFAALSLNTSAETTSALQSLAREHRLTLNTVLQGAWALLLSRYSGESDVLFGTVVSGRPPELDGALDMVGLFINSLPVRIRIAPGETLVQWLTRVQAEQAEQREFEYSPLVKVQSWSELPGGTALFDSIFLFENYHKDTPIEEMCKQLEIGDIRWFERHNYPLAALAIPSGQELELRIIYQTQRYSAEAVERMLGHWRTLLEGITHGLAARGEIAAGDLSMTTDAERRQLVSDWNDTGTNYPRERCIHDLFEEIVARSPDAIAVTHAGKSLSYGELNRRANQLAHHLRSLGVGPDVEVALCLERSLEMVVAIVGVLKAGGAYVYIDATYPVERVRFLLGSTRGPVLLTHAPCADVLPARTDDASTAAGAPRILLDTEWERIAGESDENLAVKTRADNLAYVTYTSGSTGLPKGTAIPHRAVVRLVRESTFAKLDADEVFLQFATVSFDASTLELWGSLLNGGRLVLFPGAKPSLQELGEVIANEHVTTMWLTAGLFHQMMEEHPEGLRGLRQLLAGGDVLSVAHVKQALSGLDGCTLINGYGPTENTTFTCCHSMTQASDVGRSVPIGRPISNTTVYVLDERLRPVPIGVAGDLYTGGDGLARGYRGHAALTAERFIPDPFSETRGARMYCTGDQARHRADGTLEFLGRNDHQVKIRGFRIELGEIEVALGAHPNVRDTVVLAREDTPGDKRLVGYVVCGAIRPASDELRGFLAARLPDYMVPSAFVPLDSFPLTANGKVDRRALPAPDSSRPELETAFAAPEAGTESAIAGIWQEILGLEAVGVNDNFFDLGGHSLHLIRVHGKLKEQLGTAIPMVDMFKFPTVSTLARHLESGPADEAPLQDSSERLQAGKNRLQQMRRRRK